MEEKPKSVAMNGINFGIITAVVMILVSLVLYLLDMHLNRSVTWIIYIFLLGGMIWGTLDYRKKVLNGFMSYGKAYTTSFMIVLFASIVSAIYTFLFFQVIAPDAVQDIIEMSRQQIIERSPELNDEQIDQAMQMSSFMMKPISMAIGQLLSLTIIGAVVILITSLFFKNEDKSTSSSAI